MGTRQSDEERELARTWAKLDYTDESIASALAGGATYREVASSLDVALNTVMRRMKNPALRARVVELRARQWNAAAAELRVALLGAVRKLVHLSENGATESTQLKASEAIIRSALEVKKAVDIEERLTGTESQLAELLAAKAAELDAAPE